MHKSLKIHIEKKRVDLYLWLSVFILLIQTISILSGSTDHFFRQTINNIWHLLFLVTIHFIFIEYVIKRFKLSLKGVIFALLSVFGFMMLYSFGHFAWKSLGDAIGIYFPLTPYSLWDGELEDLMAYSMGTLFLFCVMVYIYQYRNLKLQAQQLQIEKQMAELNYLKSQTNPHFLFNTLNNIYSLTRDKSEQAPESVMRLSKILRFMLYEANGKFISLEKELKIIDDYIALEKLRYDDTLQINYNYDLEDKKQAIPPLLLIPLVENAFKHGASETRRNPFVNIHLSLRDRNLTMIVKNSINKSEETEQIQENIGISNLRRQLELLYSDYLLKFEIKSLVFTANLKINLASNVEY